MKELRKNIETIAREENITEIEAISLMQAGAVKIGCEEILEALCKIKNEYINKAIA